MVHRAEVGAPEETRGVHRIDHVKANVTILVFLYKAVVEGIQVLVGTLASQAKVRQVLGLGLRLVYALVHLVQFVEESDRLVAYGVSAVAHNGLPVAAIARGAFPQVLDVLEGFVHDGHFCSREKLHLALPCCRIGGISCELVEYADGVSVQLGAVRAHREGLSLHESAPLKQGGHVGDRLQKRRAVLPGVIVGISSDLGGELSLCSFKPDEQQHSRQEHNKTRLRELLR